jgi:hypothetical protein
LTTGRCVRFWNPSRFDPAYSPTSLRNAGTVPTTTAAAANHGTRDDGNEEEEDVPMSSLLRALAIQTYALRHVPTALAVHDPATRWLKLPALRVSSADGTVALAVVVVAVAVGVVIEA